MELYITLISEFVANFNLSLNSHIVQYNALYVFIVLARINEELHVYACLKQPRLCYVLIYMYLCS